MKVVQMKNFSPEKNFVSSLLNFLISKSYFFLQRCVDPPNFMGTFVILPKPRLEKFLDQEMYFCFTSDNTNLIQMLFY